MNCKRCKLCKNRKNIVKSRGDIPADVLFIGEAPGINEDALGKAFVGRSGKLLNTAIEHAKKMSGIKKDIKIHIANTVQCIPLDKDGVIRQPNFKEAEACWNNLSELYLKVKPKHVVFLGRVAERFCKKKIPNGVYMRHPAFILRSGSTNSYAYKEFVRDLSEMFLKAEKIKKIWRKPNAV